MGQYMGIDPHKAKSFVTRLDQRGRVLEQVELSHTTGAFQQYLRRVAPDTRIAVEATGNWVWKKSGSECYFTTPLARKACGRPRWMGSFTERRNSTLTPTV